MAITTVYNPVTPVATSMKIVKEFLETYISGCDFLLERPNLDENTSIAKPIIYLEALSGSPQRMGLGMRDVSGNHVRDYILEIKINIIIDYPTGGADKAREIGDKVIYNLFKYGYLLGAAQLRNPQVTGLREIPKNTWSQFFGGSLIFTARIQLS